MAPKEPRSRSFQGLIDFGRLALNDDRTEKIWRLVATAGQSYGSQALGAVRK
jgi:hypothetical protein